MPSELLTCQRILSITVFLGFMVHHMLRVNISITIIEMVSRNDSNTTQQNYGPRYNWDEYKKNQILGYFFWGYVITQIPGGRLSEKFGARLVVGIGFVAACISTLLTPIAANSGHFWIVFARFCLGLSLGVHWPSTPTIATKWIPPTQRATFMSHMVASSLGVAITLPACSYLIASWGWPCVFYVTGTISLIWVMCWFYLIYDGPDEHPRIIISEKEHLKSLIQPLKKSTSDVAAPWSKILTSVPVWVIIVSMTSQTFTFFLVFNQLPTYMKQVLLFNIKQNGLFSSLPYLARYLASLFSGVVADKIKASGILTTTGVRKLFTVTACTLIALLFSVQSLWGDDRIISLVVFTASLGAMGLGIGGYYSNPIDVAPAYAGTIFAIAHVPAAFVGYVSTELVAFATEEKQNFQQWSYVFWVVAGVNVIGAVVALIFTSGEAQEWADLSEERELQKLENN